MGQTTKDFETKQVSGTIRIRLIQDCFVPGGGVWYKGEHLGVYRTEKGREKERAEHEVDGQFGMGLVLSSRAERYDADEKQWVAVSAADRVHGNDGGHVVE